jgi:hypothetical protein
MSHSLKRRKTLRKDSVVYDKIPDFVPIPFEKIGLYQDPFRASWPAERIRR